MQQAINDIKRALEEVKRLKGRMDTVYGSVSFSSSGGGSVSGVLLSDNLPQPVGSIADAGVGTAASRDDHVHVGAAGNQYRQFVYEVSGGDFTFIIDEVGNPVTALENLE